MATLDRIYLKTARAAEGFVRRYSPSNLDNNGFYAKWDGWDLTTFIPTDMAFTSRYGKFDRTTQRWGYEYNHPVNRKGHWLVKVPA